MVTSSNPNFIPYIQQWLNPSTCCIDDHFLTVQLHYFRIKVLLFKTNAATQMRGFYHSVTLRASCLIRDITAKETAWNGCRKFIYKCLSICASNISQEQFDHDREQWNRDVYNNHKNMVLYNLSLQDSLLCMTLQTSPGWFGTSLHWHKGWGWALFALLPLPPALPRLIINTVGNPLSMHLRGAIKLFPWQ